MVEQAPPRLPASADSIAHKLFAVGSLPAEIIAMQADIACLALERVEAIFAIIDALDLGLGGKDSNLLFDMRDMGARIVKTARAEVRRLSREAREASSVSLDIAA